MVATVQVEHAPQCGYDIDDEGVGEILDFACSACRVLLHEQGELRCLCCDGPDGLGIWHFAGVAHLRAALPRLLSQIPEDPCDVASGDPLGPIAFDTLTEAEAWLYSRDHANDYPGTEREQWLAGLRDAS